MTMTLISTVTVGSGGAASIDFTSIAGSFTDLVVAYSLRSSTTAPDVMVTFNGSATGYASRYLYGSGSSVVSGNNPYGTTAAFVGAADSTSETANTFSNASMYIPNYAGATNKSFSVDNVTENNATAAYPIIVAGLWSNTAAITRVTLALQSGANFAQYSTASLYGIKSGSGGASVSP